MCTGPRHLAVPPKVGLFNGSHRLGGVSCQPRARGRASMWYSTLHNVDVSMMCLMNY